MNSQRATHFRIWATKILNEYIRKGFVLDDERFKRGYFDYIEDLIERENTFIMAEFEKSINEFLAFRRYDILEGKGSVSRKAAVKKAEYDEFNQKRKINSNFDKMVKKMLSSEE